MTPVLRQGKRNEEREREREREGGGGREKEKIGKREIRATY